MPISVDSFRAFVSKLAFRPGMYIGLPASINNFAAALTGYEVALRDAGVELNDGLLFSWQFHRWLATELGISPVISWSEQMRERFGDDEAGITEAAKLIERWLGARDERP